MIVPPRNNAPLSFKVLGNRFEDGLRQVVGFEKMAEVEDCRLVGNGIAAKLEPRERTHRLDVVERLLGARIAELIPLLEKIDPQHHGQRIGTTTVACLGIVWLDQANKRAPWHDRFHLRQKPLAFGLLLLITVIKCGKAQLAHGKALPRINMESVPWLSGCSELP